ncbi:MAG TPA: DapH/DapD/GlmU-related protein [Gemmatimonadaceae bacterium]|nr:DapH/DapD/GlmU-related protein [Gemmatimonadaceae bacterium]
MAEGTVTDRAAGSDGGATLTTGTSDGAGTAPPPAVVAPPATVRGRRGPVGALVAVLKWLLEAVAILLVSPLAGLFLLSARLVPHRDDGIFQGYSQLMSLWPGLTGNFLRRAFYRLTLTRCARNCSIGFGTIFATAKVEIGDGVYIGPNGNIGHVSLGDDVLLGSNVTILSGKRQHRLDRLDVPVRLQGGAYDRVTVGRDVWVGNGAIVLADVGDQAVVAAGAVVTKPVRPRAIVGGNPAREIGERGAPDEQR